MDFLPFDSESAFDYMDVIHNSGGMFIPAFLITWKEPDCVCGDYSRLPYIQYIQENGEPYSVKNRPEWLKQYMPVNPADLLVINEQLETSLA